MILGRVKNYVSVAQGTEHRSPKAGVGGSNPLRDTMKKGRPRVCLFISLLFALCYLLPLRDSLI